MTLNMLTQRALDTIAGCGGTASPEVVVDAMSAHVAAPFARSALAMAVAAKAIRQRPDGLLEAPAQNRDAA